MGGKEVKYNINSVSGYGEQYIIFPLGKVTRELKLYDNFVSRQ